MSSTTTTTTTTDSRLFYQFIIDQLINYQEVKTGRIISDSFQSLPSKEGT